MSGVLLTVAYEGAPFAGFAVQPDQRTIAGELLGALQAVDPRIRHIRGASRTDAGVHARGQVAAFSCSPLHEYEGAPAQILKPDLRSAEGPGPTTPRTSEEPPSPDPRHSGWPLSRGTDRLLRAINGRLPEDVVVTACESVDPNFNPIGDTTSKAYSYLLHVASPVTRHADGSTTTGFRPVFDRQFVHHVHDALDVASMQQAASAIVGEHDFASFAAAGHGRLTTVRTVFTCSVADVTDQFDPRLLLGARRVRIDISGSGFLYNMVRIIAGTLVEVGRGRMHASDIPAIIAAKDRVKAGPTLPPSGLCLEWIRYE